jgi:hypothetical protein
MRSDGMILIAVVGSEDAEGSLAQPHGPFEHRIEYRREIAGRRIDDL